MQKIISGWGRYPSQMCELIRPEKNRDLHAYTNSCIARGQGRSYGDASLNENQTVILTERFNKFIFFDNNNGIIKAEAGITLADILSVIVSEGWFLPVTPGTQYVSLGGCVASDVHGKNHQHEGSFGNHVIDFSLILADGSHIICSPTENSAIFWATLGGMGLTGIIETVTLQLKPIKTPFISVKQTALSIDDLLDNTLDDQYSVAWIDNFRERGILMTGHVSDTKENIKIKNKKNYKWPFDFPVINKFSIRYYNYFYYLRQARKQEYVTHYQPYFYPLDNIQNWNKMYGKKGFVQYQCVLPQKEGIKELLKTTSFLSVLKRLGKPSGGLLSFPIEGFTVAMDMPIDKKILERLDNIVLAHGGRVYLAKDSCLSPDSFRKMYPHYEKFLNIKKQIDPHNIFQSSLSRRLEIGT